MFRLKVPYSFRADHIGLFSKAGEVQHDNFTLEIILENGRLEAGAVLPIENLDIDVRPVLARVKGKLLTEDMLGGPPTTEVLAAWLCSSLNFLRQRGFKGIRLTETDEAGRSWTVEVDA